MSRRQPPPGVDVPVAVDDAMATLRDGSSATWTTEAERRRVVDLATLAQRRDLTGQAARHELWMIEPSLAPVAPCAIVAALVRIRRENAASDYARVTHYRRGVSFADVLAEAGITQPIPADPVDELVALGLGDSYMEDSR